MNALHRLEGELDRLRGVEEALGLKKRVADIREHLRFLLEAESVNTVFWIERRGGSSLRQGRAIRTCRRRPSMSPSCFPSCSLSNIPSVILTSATLTVQDGFGSPEKAAWIARCAGAGGAFSLPLPGAGAALPAAWDAGSA
jgi:ATP-dependent DNA helicase DinG